MSLIKFAVLIPQVASHGLLEGIGPVGWKQLSRRPTDPRTREVSGTDGGVWCAHCVRCVSQHNQSATTKLDNWCKDTALPDTKPATVDESYCFAGSKKEYNVPGRGATTGLPQNQHWGKEPKDFKTQRAWVPGDIIEVSTQMSQQHYGTHFIDLVPQSAAQIEGLPLCDLSCPDGRLKNFKSCIQENVNQSPYAKERWQQVTIRLHPAIAMVSDRDASADPMMQLRYYQNDATTEICPKDMNGTASAYIVNYNFKLPTDIQWEAGPATMRWTWFCGWDVECGCTKTGADGTPKCPSEWYVGEGMGEIFINCVDVMIDPNGTPITDVPEHPTTCGAGESNRTSSNGDKCTDMHCKRSCQQYCIDHDPTKSVHINQCWGADDDLYIQCICANNTSPTLEELAKYNSESAECKCVNEQCPAPANILI